MAELGMRFDAIHHNEGVGIEGVLVHRHRHATGEFTDQFDLQR